MDVDPTAEVKVKRFRDRAIEARAEAEKMATPENRQLLLDVADSYQRLADSIEARALGIALPE